eukprot:snap_masked-scaffold_4-processed-gene-10.7-mRNA-1 protein AED:1.00 eAED:1.00 QI:0/0/0/0/1/1/2/0/72
MNPTMTTAWFQLIIFTFPLVFLVTFHIAETHEHIISDKKRRMAIDSGPFIELSFVDSKLQHAICRHPKIGSE